MNSLVDKVYVLYIYEAEIEKFKEQYKKSKVDFNYQLFLGINGNLFHDYFRNFLSIRREEVKNNEIYKKLLSLINNKKYFLKNEKQLGHTRSFISILKNAKKNNYKKICILESDVIFINDFNERINKYQDLIKNSKLFYLGSNDSKIRRTTSLFPFDDERMLEKIIRERPKLSDEEYKELLEKKRQNYYKKRAIHKERIEQNNILLEAVGKYHAYCPYGTFAMIIDESLYDIILETLELQVFPTDVLFFYIQSILKEDEWGVAYPNMIIADVSHSYILQERHQEKFADGRGWDLEKYCN